MIKIMGTSGANQRIMTRRIATSESLGMAGPLRSSSIKNSLVVQQTKLHDYYYLTSTTTNKISD
jgi:hypothetical protein